jgi:hypothetical protein
MTKIVINRCYGGFSLSDKAEQIYKERKGINDPDWWHGNLDRSDPILVSLIEEFGQSADGRFAELMIVDVPDDVEWQIEDYDGIEWVAEKHRVWP